MSARVLATVRWCQVQRTWTSQQRLCCRQKAFFNGIAVPIAGGALDLGNKPY
jgi:hypothetical protein